MAQQIQSHAAALSLVAAQRAKAKVLIADDERGSRMALEVALRLSGYEVVTAENGQGALDARQKNQFDLLLTDVYMPGIGGLELVNEFRRLSPNTKIIVMTAQGSLEIAMQAIAQGAFDFIAKPFDIEEVIKLVRRATEPSEAKSEPADENHFSASGIIGHSPDMVRVYKLIAYSARTATTVLIEGETGTGKELVARSVHQNSDRAAEPFTAVNCSALTETLLESELFGYTKGSFTGATADRAGLFESTNGGTIFLDEIGTASPSLQANLLRVLQEKEVRRIGSHETRIIDVRVIAAANASLEESVRRGAFRADLYYRLSVLTINIPPLRMRGQEDLELLVRHFLKKHDAKRKSHLQIAEKALEFLSFYEWMGNVRELENAIEYAVAVCSDDLITISDLPARIVNQIVFEPKKIEPVAFSLADDRPTLDELSRRYVEIVLAEAGGNKSRAADVLGINRRTLYRYLDSSLNDEQFTDVIDETGADSA